jgi:hypothetical protein
MKTVDLKIISWDNSVYNEPLLLKKMVVWFDLLLACIIRYKSELNFFNFQYPPPPPPQPTNSKFNQNPPMGNVGRSVDDHFVGLSFYAFLSFWGNTALAK